jgi:hypothetical protein
MGFLPFVQGLVHHAAEEVREVAFLDPAHFFQAGVLAGLEADRVPSPLLLVLFGSMPRLNHDGFHIPIGYFSVSKSAVLKTQGKNAYGSRKRLTFARRS